MTFKQLKAYLNDNPNGYWFKRRLYGWGWVPAKKQGWLVLLGFLAFVGAQAILLNYTPQGNNDVALFLLIVIFSALALVLICKIKGEKPAWKWGLSPEEKQKYSG